MVYFWFFLDVICQTKVIKISLFVGLYHFCRIGLCVLTFHWKALASCFIVVHTFATIDTLSCCCASAVEFCCCGIHDIVDLIGQIYNKKITLPNFDRVIFIFFSGSSNHNHHFRAKFSSDLLSCRPSLDVWPFCSCSHVLGVCRKVWRLLRWLHTRWTKRWEGKELFSFCYELLISGTKIRRKNKPPNFWWFIFDFY